jgi:hypothetical protein
VPRRALWPTLIFCHVKVRILWSLITGNYWILNIKKIIRPDIRCIPSMDAPDTDLVRYWQLISGSILIEYQLAVAEITR